MALQRDVDLDQLRQAERAITSIRDALQKLHPEHSLYLPFQFRSDGLRMMSNYFAKVPAAVVEALFDETGLAEADAMPPEPEEGPSESTEDRSQRGGYLQPFRERADADYVVNVQGGVRRRGRKHGALLNDFAKYLEARGYEVAHNAAIDLGLRQPPVIIEAKVITSWARSIREAVGQLYEYRFFGVADPKSELVFLASDVVPVKWVRFLEEDRGIGVAWREASGFRLSRLAAQSLSSRRQPK